MTHGPVMDKDRKLRLYRRKTYAEVVGFPVEIVGRDGVARHYDFEESIRLYQRRMTFAQLRFRDDDLVDAELGHCKARIEQLRRSYFDLHGWTTPAGERGFEIAHPQHAGELAAFLSVVLGEADRLDVRFTELGRDGTAELWHLARGGGAPGLLLYATFFADDDAVQADFWRRVRDLEVSGRDRGDGERLVASHHVADCGFVLTGRAEDVGVLAASVRDTTDADEADRSPWDEVQEFVRRGDLPGAWLRCRAIVDGQPWHRDAYALGAAVAILLRRPSEAEDFAFVGLGYFADDALLLHYLGLARIHQGRAADAVAPLRRAVSLAADPSASRAVLAVALARTGRPVGALRALRVHGAPSADEVALRRLASAVGWTALFASLSLLTLVLGVAGIVIVGTRALLPLVGWGVATVAGVPLFRRRLVEAVERPLFEDPTVALHRIRRTRRGAVATTP